MQEPHTTTQDNLSRYADDPEGYVNELGLGRAEREKQWSVALKAQEYHAKAQYPEGFEPWINPREPYVEPSGFAYRLRLAILRFWGSRRWDLLYLWGLMAALVLIPLERSGLANAVPLVQNALPTLIAIDFLVVALAVFLPGVAGFLLRRTMIHFLLNRGREDRTFWGVSFILALRGTANGLDVWFQESPSLEQCIHMWVPAVCRFLPPCQKMAVARRAFNVNTIKPLVERGCQIVARLCCIKTSASITPGMGVDFSPPRSDDVGQSSPRDSSEECKESNLDNGDLEVGKDADVAESAEDPAASPREAIAQQPVTELSDAGHHRDDPIDLGAPGPMGAPNADSLESPDAHGRTSDMLDLSQEEVSFANTDTETEVSFDPTDTETDVSSILTLSNPLEDIDIGAVNPFSVITTKQPVVVRKVMSNMDRNQLPEQSARDPTPPSFEEQIVPFDTDKSVTWLCRTCGRWNRQPLHSANSGATRMKIGKTPIPGTSKVQFKVVLSQDEGKQTCRICGTEFDYKPTKYNEKNFFQTNGDDDVSVYRKKRQADKVAHRLTGKELEGQDPNKRKKRAKPGGIRSSRKAVHRYRASKAEVAAEVEAARKRGYHGFDVGTSKPPWIRSKDQSLLVESDEEEDEEKDDVATDLPATPAGVGRQRRGGLFSGIVEDPTGAARRVALGASDMTKQIGTAQHQLQNQIGSMSDRARSVQDQVARRQSVQMMLTAYKGANAAFRMAQKQARRQAQETDMLFNDFRLKARAAEFRPEFYRTRGPVFADNEYFPVHSIVECNAHNPEWAPGIITRVHQNNTYDVRFDDGTDVQCVEYTTIRFRLRERISLIVQAYALCVLFIAFLAPLCAAIFFLASDYPSYTVQQQSASAIPLVLPALFASLFIFIGHAVQIMCLYAKHTHAAGWRMHVRFWCFFAFPGLLLLLFSCMTISKLQDPKQSRPWLMCFSPMPFTSAYLYALMKLYKPAYGALFLKLGILWSVFILALGVSLDFRGLFPKVAYFALAAPLMLMVNIMIRFHKRLPYIWNALFDVEPDVEPEQAALRATAWREQAR